MSIPPQLIERIIKSGSNIGEEGWSKMKREAWSAVVGLLLMALVIGAPLAVWVIFQ